MGKIEICTPVDIVDRPRSPYRATANFTVPQAQPDLMFMRSVFVSTGRNNNDDVFLPSEMWGARSTPAFKPVDWEHNTGRELTLDEQKQNPGKVVVDNQTIGVMYSTYAIDEDDNVINEDVEIPENFHIVDESVIWKKLYPQTAAKIEQGAKENKLFVSMEAWFSDYDYLVGNKVVARNEETAFLDNTLRAFGGNGIFGNSRVYRVLRGITFGGKGIVARPANEPSVIQSISHEPMCSSASSYDVINKNIISDIKAKASQSRRGLEMANANDVKTSDSMVPLEQYTKAHDEATELRSEVKNKEGELAKANEKISGLEKQVENVKSAFAKGAEQLDSLLPSFSSRVTKGNPENFFSVLSETLEEDSKAKQDLENKLKAALEKVQKVEEDARTVARETRVDSVLQKSVADEKEREERKSKLVSSIKTLSDEDFDSLIETLESLAPTEAAEDGKYKKDKGKEDKRKEDKEKKDKSKMSASASELAKKLGTDEATASTLLDALNSKAEKEDEDVLSSVLDSVKSSEKTPPPGGDSQGGVDLTQAYSGLVDSILNAHKPEGEK